MPVRRSLLEQTRLHRVHFRDHGANPVHEQLAPTAANDLDRRVGLPGPLQGDGLGQFVELLGDRRFERVEVPLMVGIIRGQPAQRRELSGPRR